MQQKTTPADRAKALLSKFGVSDHPYAIDHGYSYSDYADAGDLTIWADCSEDDLSISVYEHEIVRPLLRLSGVQDDDLVASIIQQVIDHHNGKQVV